MLDKFIAYWVHVAKRFAKNKYVMGFDPMNEPSTPTDNLLHYYMAKYFGVRLGYYDKHILAPLYTRIQKEAYKVASNDTIMYFENAFDIKNEKILNIWERDGVVFRTGYDKPPGGEIGSPNHAVNAHTYCCQLNNGVCATGEPAQDAGAECLKFHQDRLGQRAKDAKRLGVPIFVSEFGACLDTDICVRELNQVGDVCEDDVMGWSYWQYKTYKDLTTSAGNKSEGFYNPDGAVQKGKVKALSRPYVQLAQGMILGSKMNRTSGQFTA
jgi:aryl-phospho-beta-D-glucosidase BglC (GH1 family)